MAKRDPQKRQELLDQILKLVRSEPGIRASEINRRIGREHSAHYRSALIDQGLVRKERDGPAVRYYPTRKRG
jgi:predicted transcriptional regulator